MPIIPICLCIFIKKPEFKFSIIAMYVGDLNFVGTLEELIKIATYLKEKFEMKYFGKIIFFLGLQIEHLPSGILIHQSIH